MGIVVLESDRLSSPELSLESATFFLPNLVVGEEEDIDRAKSASRV